jgi:hypothetical protein
MKKPLWYWILLVALVALLGNMILELGWMAPWDPSGKLTLAVGIGVLWIFGQRKQAEREKQAPDPAKTELTIEWSDPATRRNRWRIAAFCLVVVLFIWGAQWFAARGRTEPGIMLTTGVMVVAILIGVLYRNHFRVVDTVTQTGTGLQLQRGRTVDQVLFSDLAAIDEVQVNSVARFELVFREKRPPWGEKAQFLPSRAGMTAAERAIVLARMREAAGLGNLGSAQ